MMACLIFGRLLTIARAGKHVAKYYETAKTGVFADKLPLGNIKAEVDLPEMFPAEGFVRA